MTTAILYSDLNAIDPFNKPIVENLEAIYSFIHNLLNTSKGERPFNPEIGLDLDEILFELATEDRALQIYQMIVSAFESWMPDVTINYAGTNVTPIYDDYRYEIEIYFILPGWNEEIFIGGEVSK